MTTELGIRPENHRVLSKTEGEKEEGIGAWGDEGGESGGGERRQEEGGKWAEERNREEGWNLDRS